jgi:hypothetical protein
MQAGKGRTTILGVSSVSPGLKWVLGIFSQEPDGETWPGQPGWRYPRNIVLGTDG